MRSFLELLGIDPEAKAQRRANALAKADFDFIRDLVKIRKDQGLSQQDVADRLGITQATVADFERYDNDPKLSTIRRYAHAVEALIVHGVAHDDGQLAAGDGWVTITFNAPKSSSTVVPATSERTVVVTRGQLALAA